MYDRYRAVESEAYKVRRDLKLKTRVKLGRNDIEFSIRDPRSTTWRKQALPDNLPEFDFDSYVRPEITSSPPPGRPGRFQVKSRAVESEQNEVAEVVQNTEEQ